LAFLCAALTSAVAAVRASAQAEVADLREDVQGLTQRVNELSLRIEQLEHDNAQLKAKLDASGRDRDTVTAEQLNAAVAALNLSIKSAVDSSRADILQTVAGQMENLAKQTNQALDSVAKNAAAVQVAPPAKGGDAGAAQGATYTVQKGDSVGMIARKTGARVQDIVEANKLADPSKILVGQVLVVPGGK
jgi:LysM repeat protein/FtsZ-binding cell division protein ZapB